MLSRAFWTLLTVLAPLSAQAQTIPSQLNKLLTNELKPRVKTFSRPVTVYHWTYRSDVKIPLQGEIGSTDERFNQYLDRQVKQYFKPHPRNRDIWGAGLYLAIDPVATQRYGGRNWVLYALEFKKGTRFLDLRSSSYYSGIFFSKRLREQLRNFGCPADSAQQLFSQDEIAECQVLRVAIARSPELKVVAAYYPYTAETFIGCLREGIGMGAAFVAWDRGAFSINSSALIRELPSSDPAAIRKTKALVQKIFELSATAQSLSGAQLTKFMPYPSLEGAVTDAQAKQFMRKSLMSCGTYPEDRLD